MARFFGQIPIFLAMNILCWGNRNIPDYFAVVLLLEKGSGEHPQDFAACIPTILSGCCGSRLHWFVVYLFVLSSAAISYCFAESELLLVDKHTSPALATYLH